MAGLGSCLGYNSNTETHSNPRHTARVPIVSSQAFRTISTKTRCNAEFIKIGEFYLSAPGKFSEEVEIFEYYTLKAAFISTGIYPRILKEAQQRLNKITSDCFFKNISSLLNDLNAIHGCFESINVSTPSPRVLFQVVIEYVEGGRLPDDPKPTRRSDRKSVTKSWSSSLARPPASSRRRVTPRRTVTPAKLPGIAVTVTVTRSARGGQAGRRPSHESRVTELLVSPLSRCRIPRLCRQSGPTVHWARPVSSQPR